MVFLSGFRFFQVWYLKQRTCWIFLWHESVSVGFIWCKGTLQEVIINVIANAHCNIFHDWIELFYFCHVINFKRGLCQILRYNHWRFALGKCFITDLAGNSAIAFSEFTQRKCLWLKRVKHFLLRKCHTSPTICRMPKLSFSVLEMNYNILKYLSLLPFKEIS